VQPRFLAIRLTIEKERKHQREQQAQGAERPQRHSQRRQQNAGVNRMGTSLYAPPVTSCAVGSGRGNGVSELPRLIML
jgi:hypothetical protein